MDVELIAVGAREDVLRRIRTSIGTPAANAPAIEAEWNTLPREYNRVGSLDREAVLEMLDERLRDYDASVIRIQSGAVAETIAKQLTERGKHRLVIPKGLAEALGEALPAGFEFVVDEGLSTTELDSFEGVVTASTVAIAETGTIVLQNVAGEGRRAPTLVPDYHLCIVRAGDVVENVPEAMTRLAATASLATTFVSGPSATADIEMTRIKGVHGPRFLDVILVT
ncbi:MAG: LUD domain-containing protein [Acidobacteriaceae bacterium]|nr:LUD domain-containing protein [Acidobacteriaceae bacterium]